MSLRFLLTRTPRAPPTPPSFSLPLSSFHFLSISLPLILPSWCWDVSHSAVSRSVLFFPRYRRSTTPHGLNNSGTDPALSGAPGLQSGTQCRCRIGVGGWGGRGVVSAPSASNCLFVCFSSFVLCCHASRSAPEVPGPSGSDCSDPDSPPQLCSLAPHLHVFGRATGEEGFATLHRIFYEFTQTRVCE